MNLNIVKLCHITPHGGGGVGAVIKDFISSSFHDFEHTLFCLDKCNTNFDDIFVNGGKADSLFYASSFSITKALELSDVILIHYWNHPLLTNFIATTHFPACRLLVWCHNSGLQEPHIIPAYLVNMATKVMFTSCCSLNAPNLRKYIKKDPEKFCVVHSTHDLELFYQIGLARKRNLVPNRLLYVGTVSKSKMHGDSAEMFSLLSKLGYDICVVGGPDHQVLLQDVVSLGGIVNVVGFSKSVLQFYKNADVFLYPLRAEHYGTGEQVMLEAMAAGLPIVAFNNPAESKIVINGETGYLVNSSDAIIAAVNDLTFDSELYQEMSKKSIRRVSRDFDSHVMARKLAEQVNNAMSTSKSVPCPPMEHITMISEFDVFVLNSFFDEEFIDFWSRNRNDKIDYVFYKIKERLDHTETALVWLSNTKSSPFHYLHYFNENKDLIALTKMINDLCS